MAASRPEGWRPLPRAMAKPCSKPARAWSPAARVMRRRTPRAATRSRRNSASTPRPACSHPSPARPWRCRPAWVAGRSVACACAWIRPATPSCVWPAIPTTRWPRRRRYRWRCRSAMPTPAWAASAAWRGVPPRAPAARPCRSSSSTRTACCNRSSAWARVARVNGRPSRSSNWSRRSAKAATCLAKAMWMGCAPSLTRRR